MEKCAQYMIQKGYLSGATSGDNRQNKSVEAAQPGQSRFPISQDNSEVTLYKRAVTMSISSNGDPNKKRGSSSSEDLIDTSGEADAGDENNVEVNFAAKRARYEEQGPHSSKQGPGATPTKKDTQADKTERLIREAEMAKA